MNHLQISLLTSEVISSNIPNNIACTRVNLGNTQGAFFVVCTQADCNYKITKFTVFVRGGGEEQSLRLSFEHLRAVTKTEQVQARGERGSKFRAFCERNN